jgi:hypothetical protein
MKYMRITAGYTWTDHKTNTEIAKKKIKYNPSFEQDFSEGVGSGTGSTQPRDRIN